MTDDLINHLNICVIELDEQLRLTFLNAAAQSQALEVSGKQARDQHIGDIFQFAAEVETILRDVKDWSSVYGPQSETRTHQWHQHYLRLLRDACPHRYRLERDCRVIPAGSLS